MTVLIQADLTWLIPDRLDKLMRYFGALFMWPFGLHYKCLTPAFFLSIFQLLESQV